MIRSISLLLLWIARKILVGVFVYQHIITTKLSSQSEMKDRVGKISAPTKLVQESFFDTAAVSGSEANPVNVNVQWVSGLTRR